MTIKLRSRKESGSFYLEEAMTENEFLLQDRLQKIRSMNEQYNLEVNAYLSFSGGRDSTILHHLLDEALPGNKIPRVYINTGIEYKEVLKFVRSLQERDPRVIIYNSGVNIKQMLETKGYPFKSKEYAMTLSIYQNSGRTKTVKKYLGEEPGHTCPKYMCPPKLRYQFSEDFKINISKKCCNELKKKPAARYAREAGKSITITGMRSSEGGQRSNISCSSFEDNKLVKFHPLVPVPGEWMSWYQREREIVLSSLYYPPYNFQRTGCKGCPFAPELQQELDTMHYLLPEEEKQCEYLWAPVYAEYRRIGYRLRTNEQKELF